VEENIGSETRQGIRGIKVASILSWFWGVLLWSVLLRSAFPMISQGRPVIFLLLLVVLGILFCVAGYGLRKQRQYARWLAVVCQHYQFCSLAPFTVPNISNRTSDFA